MSLLERIGNALKDAIREKDENRRNALRLLLTAIKVKEKELKRPLAEMELQRVIASQIKQRKETIEQYRNAGRNDLSLREEEEMRVLEAFVPEAMTKEALEKLIDEVIIELGARSPKEMGRVMKALMPRVAGRADGKLINELVKNKLQPPLDFPKMNG